MNIFSFKSTAVFAFALLFMNTSASAQAKKADDSELKKEITPLTNSLSYISKLQPLSFRYSPEQISKLNLPAGQQYGFLSEDVQKVIPGIVKSENKMIPRGKNAFRTVEMKNVDLESLIPMLVGSIQEQQAEIEKLKSELQSLKSMAAADSNAP